MAAVENQRRFTEAGQHSRVVDDTAHQRGPDCRRRHHGLGCHKLQLCRRYIHDHIPGTPLHGLKLQFRVISHGIRHVLCGLRPQHAGKLFNTQAMQPVDHDDAADTGLPVVAQVITNHQRAVGPAHKDRRILVITAYDRLQVIGVQFTVQVVFVARRALRVTVPAQVKGDQVKFLSQFTAELLNPYRVSLRPAVDKQDSRRFRVAGVFIIQPGATGAIQVTMIE